MTTLEEEQQLMEQVAAIRQQSLELVRAATVLGLTLSRHIAEVKARHEQWAREDDAHNGVYGGE